MSAEQPKDIAALMTMRDYMAIQVAPELLREWREALTHADGNDDFSWSDGGSTDETLSGSPESAAFCVACDAYAIADAMLAQRVKKTTHTA